MPYIDLQYIQENIQDKVKQLAHELQEVLECPVCSETMDSTLRQCMKGHGVCRPCARKIDKCPTCKQELALALHKNTLLNQLLDLIPKLCPYAEEGCVSVIVNHEHQTYCEYRPTECKLAPSNYNTILAA
ncbi:E3 ubiquitin-protein ligase SIAH2-like [Macrosteles quadrilineatus]|uniref:E3 ubiquitin-protein ligase SIAH2-like n=1 Tax=Macrosteles quadrilineatus TaxID=74068 RepID=UPI0023E13C1E|nr:E3 ubiquitin-protein ligase SIAH2-like [Macrosteles quadrilineatus]